MEGKKYKYTGAQSLIELHKKHLQSFYKTWRIAKEKSLTLPQTKDADYKSLDHLLLHVLRSSGRYITWICAQLELPDPGIAVPPPVNKIEDEARSYLNHVIAKWEDQLADVKEEKFIEITFKSNWGVQYCIDAMLEHAVMHPIRHQHQLLKLLKEQS
jgi:uncharacterized damage-inducible protein DinB